MSSAHSSEHGQLLPAQMSWDLLPAAELRRPDARDWPVRKPVHRIQGVVKQLPLKCHPALDFRKR